MHALKAKNWLQWLWCSGCHWCDAGAKSKVLRLVSAQLGLSSANKAAGDFKADGFHQLASLLVSIGGGIDLCYVPKHSQVSVCVMRKCCGID